MSRSKSKSSPSEVHAYVYIIKELIEKKGWSKSQIYTQQECGRHTEIKKYLGLTKPENIVDIDGKNFYIIEAKNERKKLQRALKEAREDYANKINQGNKITLSVDSDFDNSFWVADLNRLPHYTYIIIEKRT